MDPGKNHIFLCKVLKDKARSLHFSTPSNSWAGTFLLWKCLHLHESALETVGGSARGTMKQRRRENLSRNDDVMNTRRFRE